MSPEELRKAGLPILAANQAQYFMSMDHGRPGGDKTMRVIFDRLNNEIVSIKEIETGVDDQGEAVVVEPLALPPPEERKD